jgi:gamma-glutamyltranspeptidase/glutathione hydrolase
VKCISKRAYLSRQLQGFEVSGRTRSCNLISYYPEMGHDARIVKGFDRGMMGRGQVIQRIVDGAGKAVWAAGSDPRADGHAAPQI